MQPNPAPHPPQLAHALAALTLPSFEELAVLTGLDAKLAPLVATPALIAATADQHDWKHLRMAA